MLKRLNISATKSYYFLLLILGFWLLSIKQRQHGGIDDLDVFFNAGKRLLQQEDIYGPPHFYNLKYFYSVLFASLMASAQGLGIAVVKWLWFIVNAGLLMRVLLILKQEVFKDDSKQAWYLLLLSVMMVKIVMANFTYNQITIWMLWLMLEAYRCFQNQKFLLGILLLCIGINIKLLPMVMVPYLLWAYPQPLKHLGIGSVALVILFLLPVLWLGYDYNTLLFKAWWHTLNPVSDVHSIQTYEYGLMDVSACITKYCSAELVYLEPDLHVLDLPKSVLFLLVNGVRVALLAMAVHLAWRHKTSALGVTYQLAVFAAFMALIPLCFPHQREYSYLLLMPMLAIQFKQLFAWQQKGFIACFIAFVLLSAVWLWKDSFGETALNWVNYHRLLTIGSVGLYVLNYIMLRSWTKSLKEAV